MIILDDLRVEMTGYRKEMTELADVLDIKAAKARIEQLGEETAKPGFWDDLENSQAVLKEQKALERKIEKYNKLNESLEDVITLIELSIEEEDDSSIEEIKSEAESFKKKLEEERHFGYRRLMKAFPDMKHSRDRKSLEKIKSHFNE